VVVVVMVVVGNGKSNGSEIHDERELLKGMAVI